jgi:hypothetical protein
MGLRVRVVKKIGGTKMLFGKNGVTGYKRFGDVVLSYHRPYKSKGTPEETYSNYDSEDTPWMTGVFWNMGVMALGFLGFSYLSGSILAGLLSAYIVYIGIHTFIVASYWNVNKADVMLQYFTPVFGAFVLWWAYLILFIVALFLV